MINQTINGLKEGYWETNDKDFTSKCNYINGKIDGLYELYQDGELAAIVNYKNGLKHGLCIVYYAGEKNSMNRLYKSSNYTNGLLDGSYCIYFHNGNIMEEMVYENDKKISSKKYSSNSGILNRNKDY